MKSTSEPYTIRATTRVAPLLPEYPVALMNQLLQEHDGPFDYVDDVLNIKTMPSLKDTNAHRRDNMYTLHGKDVVFYSEADSSSFLSNLYEKAEFRIGSLIYKTPLHYYFSFKFGKSSQVQTIIRNLPTAKSVIRYISGNNAIQMYKVNNWHAQKDNCLELGLYHKFTAKTNINVAYELFATGPGKILNVLPDGYYGAGANGLGSNKLGEMLFNVRRGLDPILIQAEHLKRVKEYAE